MDPAAIEDFSCTIYHRRYWFYDQSNADWLLRENNSCPHTCHVFLRIIQSNLAPSIATGLLPAVTNATEISFIVSVLFFSFILMLGVTVFKLNEGIEKKVKIQYRYMMVFLMIIFLWIALCWLFGYELAVIPPILVVVYESLQKPMYHGKMGIKMALKQGIVLTTSATVGTLLYFAMESWLLITILDMILMYILLQIVGVRIPAAYAFPLLPFVFPDDVAAKLPLGSLITCIALFSLVLAFKQYEQKRTGTMMQM